MIPKEEPVTASVEVGDLPLCDLQVVACGPPPRSMLCEAIRRNVFERWPVRYPHLEISKVAPSPGSLIAVAAHRDGEASTVRIRIGEVADRLLPQGPGPRDIAAVLDGARSYLFLWILPAESLAYQKEERIFRESWSRSLLAWVEVIHSLKLSPHAGPVALHILESETRESRFGCRPWINFYPRKDGYAEEAIRRKAPDRYAFLKASVEDVRFHSFPWNPGGCHLSFAPRWIDRLLEDALGTPLFGPSRRK